PEPQGFHPAHRGSGNRQDDALEPVAGLVARTAGSHSIYFQFAHGGKSSFRFHDGGFRDSMRIARKEPGATTAEPMAAGALSRGRNRGFDRGRSAKPVARGLGRNTATDQPGDFHGKAAANRADRSARARRKAQNAVSKAVAPADHTAMPHLAADARRNIWL